MHGLIGPDIFLTTLDCDLIEDGGGILNLAPLVLTPKLCVPTGYMAGA